MNNFKTIISLDNVNKISVHGRHILKGLNLNVFPGELIGLLGHSGCGKSTLMNIVCGIDSAYTGDVYIRGLLANKMDIYSRKIRFLDNNTVLFSYMNVLDNIKIGFGVESVLSEQEKICKIQNILSMLKLDNILFLNPNTLSHGQQQKVKFARAIIDSPQVVMLDEPFDGLDSLSSEIIYKIIDDMNAKMKTTFIISSHDTYEILDLAKRLIIMNEGAIVVDQMKTELLLKHNRYSWDYFNIGSILQGVIRDITEASIVISVFDDVFSLSRLEYSDKISGNIAIGKQVLLYVNPRSGISMANSVNQTVCYVIKIIDFIFYYQNILDYYGVKIQINTITKLEYGVKYNVALDFILVEIIEE